MIVSSFIPIPTVHVLQPFCNLVMGLLLRLSVQFAHVALERDDQAQRPLTNYVLGVVSILVGGRAMTRRLKLIRELLDQLYSELSETFHVKLRVILRGLWRWKLMQHI